MKISIKGLPALPFSDLVPSRQSPPVLSNKTHSGNNPELHYSQTSNSKMVKLSTLALAVAGALPLASAKACTDGLIYCGFNLRKIGTQPMSAFHPLLD
jgi:hypothetical protein